MIAMQTAVTAAFVLLAYACSVTWAECTAEMLPVMEECTQVVKEVTKNGAEPTQSCSDAKTILDCYKKLEEKCEEHIKDDTMYIRMKEKDEQCAAPRPSVGFVLIAVSVISMLLAANRY